MKRTLPYAAALAALGAVAIAPAESLAARAKRKRPEIDLVITPLGLQGSAGAGANVVVPFRLANAAGRLCDVEMQYGVDRDGDGAISDEEYTTFTENRTDSRNTRRDRKPMLFTGGRSGSTIHGIVWRSGVDLPAGRFVAQDYLLDEEGRLIADPDEPDDFLRAVPDDQGLKVRLRAVRGRREGSWVESGVIRLDNSHEPVLSIDSVTGGETVVADFTVADGDSEDLDDDGILDVVDGEDVNGNGVLDVDRAGVAWDFHRLAPGEDPALLSDEDLAALVWFPCTRKAGEGDTNRLESRPGVPVPETGELAGVPTSPGGRSFTFAWDAIGDAGPTTDGIILRARPFDQRRARGQTVYSREVVHITQ